MSMSIERLTKADRSIEVLAAGIGRLLVSGFHYLALFAIGASIVWAAAFAFIGMMHQGTATIEDILLLFIYLELGAMVGIYFKTEHMPVRFLIYIAITALTRLLIDFVNVEHKPDMTILFVAGAILLLTFAVLVLRFGSSRFPSVPSSKSQPMSATDSAG